MGLELRKGNCPAVAAIISDVGLFEVSLSICHRAKDMAWRTHRDLWTGAGILVAPLRPRDAFRLFRMLSAFSTVFWNMLHKFCVKNGCTVWEKTVFFFLRLTVLLPWFRGAKLARVYLSEGAARSAAGCEQATGDLRVDLLLRRVSECLAGRLVTFPELVSHHPVVPDGFGKLHVRAAVDALSLLGLVEMIPGIASRWPGLGRCSRCGSTRELYCVGSCAICGSACVRCTRCSSLGPMTSCTWLFHMPIERAQCIQQSEQVDVIPQIPFPLTKTQKRASERVCRFLESSDSWQFLVWAVCGAGKTEVVCDAIAAALRLGGTVLYVVPRQTLASELYLRLAGYFPSIQIGLRTGSKRVGPTDAKLTVCTAHQTLRLKHLADLVIFDEIDAYPCQPGSYLERAVERSVRPKGKIVYLTATPDGSLFERVRTGKLPFALIPERHHGRPIPVPQIVIVSCRRKSGSFKIDARVDRALRRDCLIGKVLYRSPTRAMHRIPCGLDGTNPAVTTSLLKAEICLLCLAASLSPALLFVPTIGLVEKYRNALKSESMNCWKGIAWGFCCSRLPGNDEVVSRLRNGEIDCIVTTTVLERGITVPRVNVIVAGADSPVFDERSLVQMAGRAGRSPDCPTGTVVFMVERVTRQVERAIRMIEFMNERIRT